MANPTLAVWKFASCDGCQLTLLDCEDELLTLAGQVEIATFAEASSAMVGGPYDVSLVEGSVTTAADERRIREIRDQSTIFVTIGACATAGGIQALRNFADVAEFASVVYATARVHRHAGHVHTGVGTRHRRLRTARVPDRPRPVAGHARRAADRAQAAAAGRDGVHRVQAQRGDVRHRRRGHSVPGTGHPCRLRRAVPAPSPRLLRMLRPDGHTEHARVLSVACAVTACPRVTSTGCTRPSTSPSSPPNEVTE